MIRFRVQSTPARTWVLGFTPGSRLNVRAVSQPFLRGLGRFGVEGLGFRPGTSNKGSSSRICLKMSGRELVKPDPIFYHQREKNRTISIGDLPLYSCS